MHMHGYASPQPTHHGLGDGLGSHGLGLATGLGHGAGDGDLHGDGLQTKQEAIMSTP